MGPNSSEQVNSWREAGEGAAKGVEARTLWALNRLMVLLGVRAEKADKFLSGFTTEETSARAIARFMDDPECPACYFAPTSESVSCTIDLPSAQQMRKKVVAMHRSSPEVQISKENLAESVILMEMTKNVMDLLNMYCQSVYLSTLTNPANQAGWSDLIAQRPHGQVPCLPCKLARDCGPDERPHMATSPS